MAELVYYYALPRIDLAVLRQRGRNRSASGNIACAVTWTKAQGYQVFSSDGLKDLRSALQSNDEEVGFDLTGSHYDTSRFSHWGPRKDLF
ncbi:MAG: hypothetical protein EOP84_14925 [Verrucomicrobiaceae bacterium]|nr:MAG: hypothetical protein EOP84_14925 [Verrucomicrobiaceae bacterium]